MHKSQIMSHRPTTTTVLQPFNPGWAGTRNSRTH